MLIHPWDAALDTSEWQNWLASTDRFGILAVNNLDPAQAPVVLPAHFTVAGDDELLMPGPAEPGLAPPGGGPRGTAGCDRRLRLHPDLLAGQGRRPR
jgi:transcriptional regulator